MNKMAHVIYGHTYCQIDPHLRLCGVSRGQTGLMLVDEMRKQTGKITTNGYDITGQTNRHLLVLVNDLVNDPLTKIIFFPVAVVDFTTMYHNTRLTSDCPHQIMLSPAMKIAKTIREERKDIFLVTFKVVEDWDNVDRNVKTGMSHIKKTSANLTVINDAHCDRSLILTPEEGVYEYPTREETIANLVEMTLLRSQLTFTRSTVVDGALIPWGSPLVPQALRHTIDWLRGEGAYKAVNGITAGHFAVKLSDTEFLTSIRRTNFNNIVNMVKVVTDGPDNIIAYGARPSVGGQSQRAVFAANPTFDSIVHFHCPQLPSSIVPIVSQMEFECGSHECGDNTANGLELFDHGIAAVMLDMHGPNIVFDSRKTTGDQVIAFIKANYDLTQRTNGYHY